MRSDKFIATVASLTTADGAFQTARKGLPLGLDVGGNIALAQKSATPLSVRHTCVTGSEKTAFICRLLLTVSCLYNKAEACFLVLSNQPEYAELLRLKSMDFTLPYLREKTDLEQATETVKTLLKQREQGKGYPHLFIVLDGVEALPGCNRNGDLEEQRDIIDLCLRRNDVDIIVGADLSKTVYNGYPAAFVGAGNSVITTLGKGRAEVAYVQEDGVVASPFSIEFPDEPSLTETVISLNSLPGYEK